MEGSLEARSPKFAVSAEFDSFADLKHACQRAALLDVYEFIPERVSTTHYTLKCKSPECLWYLYASPVSDTSVWRIRTSSQTHTCHGLTHLGHHNIDEEFISTEILPKLREDASYAPKAIMRDIKAEYGVEISYQKARRAKERALSHINGSHEDAYRHLPKYCQEIERSNPGSTVKLEINPATNQFKRLFICFAASAMGFAYCRPVLGLDGTHLKHKYQGIKERLMFLIDQAFFSLPPQSTPKVNCFPLHMLSSISKTMTIGIGF